MIEHSVLKDIATILILLLDIKPRKTKFYEFRAKRSMQLLLNSASSKLTDNIVPN